MLIGIRMCCSFGGAGECFCAALQNYNENLPVEVQNLLACLCHKEDGRQKQDFISLSKITPSR